MSLVARATYFFVEEIGAESPRSAPRGMTEAHHQQANQPSAGPAVPGIITAEFLNFYRPLHERFVTWQRELVAKRQQTLAAAHRGDLPDHLPPSEATEGAWNIDLPDWCKDQRNQMTGPADDRELVVKMLNSGAPGVMLDLEDSMVSQKGNMLEGVTNILSAQEGTLSYYDKKRDRTVPLKESRTVIFNRPRGLHLDQDGIVDGEKTSASLIDVALIAFHTDTSKLKHPLSFYVPKSESAEEALWWRDVFETIAEAKGLPRDYIKCMALAESHPMVYQMEEFIYNLRDHILGLNLGRWDYMASLIEFNLHNPAWVLPDRNTISHNVAFFQRVRELIPEICHKRGILAIGGMTALFPNRADLELNERALKSLAQDKANEAASFMDGAWTGHPDQNEIAVDQFPYPNQVDRRPPDAERRPELRPVVDGDQRTIQGTRDAVRGVIRYRYGVITGKGASLLDGYMEDLATDRIYRLMIAQRILHHEQVPIVDKDGATIAHTPDLVSKLFDEELDRILVELSDADEDTRADYREARTQSENLMLEHKVLA